MLRLWAAGAANSLEEDVYRSRSALLNGSAYRRFAQWHEAVSLAAVERG